MELCIYFKDVFGSARNFTTSCMAKVTKRVLTVFWIMGEAITNTQMRASRAGRTVMSGGIAHEQCRCAKKKKAIPPNLVRERLFVTLRWVCPLLQQIVKYVRHFHIKLWAKAPLVLEIQLGISLPFWWNPQYLTTVTGWWDPWRFHASNEHRPIISTMWGRRDIVASGKLTNNQHVTDSFLLLSRWRNVPYRIGYSSVAVTVPDIGYHYGVPCLTAQVHLYIHTRWCSLFGCQVVHYKLPSKS